MENLDVDTRIILKPILKELVGRACTRLIWLRIEKRGGIRYLTFGFLKRQAIS